MTQWHRDRMCIVTITCHWVTIRWLFSLCHSHWIIFRIKRNRILADPSRSYPMRKGNNLSLNLSAVQKPRVNLYQTTVHVKWIMWPKVGVKKRPVLNTKSKIEMFQKGGLGWTKIKWACIEFIINVGSERFPLFLKILLALWAYWLSKKISLQLDFTV